MPGRDEDSVPGLLKIGDRGAPTLQIFGWFPEATDERHPTAGGHLPAILGDCQGRSVSLWSASVSWEQGDPRSMWPASQSSQIFEGHQLLAGGRHFPDPDEPCFRSVNISTTHLDAWAGGQIDPREEFSSYSKLARLSGARITAHGGAYPFGSPQSSGNTVQHGIQISLTSATTLEDMYFTWERPVLSYLTVAVDDEVHVLRRTAQVGSGHRDFVDVVTRGGLPDGEVERLWSWSLVMSLRDGKFEKRLRRWFEIDRQAAHGMVSLGMTYAANNRWTNNRLMNVASALESLASAVAAPPKDAEVAARRRRIGKAIPDSSDQSWFYDATQHAARPSFATLLRALHSPVADAIRPMVQDSEDWVARLVAARNGIAHALDEHIRG